MKEKIYLKTVKEKFETKLNKLLREEFVTRSDNSISFKETKIFSFDEKKISYGTTRVAPKNIDPFYEDDYKVSILLSHKNINLLGSNLLKPPYGARVVVNVLRDYVDDIKEIEIGSGENKISDGKVCITKELYLTITKINKEEGVDKIIRIKNRTIPFLKTDFGLSDIQESEVERDYGLLLREIISSNQLTSTDVLSLTDKLEAGDDSKIVIAQEINKQTEWLLEILRKIIDEPKLTTALAKEYGKRYFNYTKNSIVGPEHLMEKILTDYGKNIIFGVPALLNTDKYVISKLPKVQFDIILIDNLSDIEIVELKRPDVYVLEFDPNRNKFYPSQDLSVAIGQAERYITTLYKDNDPNFKINNKTIKKYIEAEIGGSVELNITRPSATIVIGGIHRIAKDYSELSIKRPQTRGRYEENMWQAYRELKSTHKNIRITTYSELVDGAELRLKS
ncbi:MAG: Shedu anti-phage system protein SduA domain-containing protein [Parcubacteria group bacterium]